MSARSVDIFVLAFTDPVRSNGPQERRRIDSAQSFEYPTTQVQTLSTNTVNTGSQIEGLLYVPTLPDDNPCINASDPYIPKNVTRITSLPPVNYQYVAIAPWISQECTQAYLSATPGRLARAFIFYQPSQNSTDKPPDPNDRSWSLNDGGTWKKSNRFPVYAIPGPNGNIIMQQLAQYSGPISSVRNGAQLSEELDSSDYIRLYANFDLDINGNLPTLWAFLLIVVAVVLLLVGSTSWAMHCVQRRKRRQLLQRVQRGEVDLEVLGLKAQQMTRADIDSLPLSPYVPKKDAPDMPIPDPTSTTPDDKPAPAHQPQDYNQPTCPICLEDFIPDDQDSPVRALPCNHIYHPQCIDQYLLATSSLCPLCKSNAKPPNPSELPEITNIMVRRERQARRFQEGRRETGVYSRGEGFRGRARGFAALRRHSVTRVPIVRPLPIQHRTTTSVPRIPEQNGAIEMQPPPVSPSRQSAVMRELENATQGASSPERANIASQTAASPMDGNTAAAGTSAGAEAITPAPLGAEERRERAEGLLRAHGGNGADRAEIEAVNQRERPRWRKGIGRVFPGFN